MISIYYRAVAECATIEVDNLPLRGDILVKCFQRTCTAERSLFFRCQFNTCTFDLSANSENVYRLRFYREELDNIFNSNFFLIFYILFQQNLHSFLPQPI